MLRLMAADLARHRFGFSYTALLLHLLQPMGTRTTLLLPHRGFIPQYLELSPASLRPGPGGGAPAPTPSSWSLLAGSGNSC